MSHKTILLELTPEQFQFLSMSVRSKVAHDERGLLKKSPDHHAYHPTLSRIHVGHELIDLLKSQDPNDGVYIPPRTLSAAQVRGVFDRANARRAARREQLESNGDDSY